MCVEGGGEPALGRGSSLWQRLIIMTRPFSVRLRDIGEAAFFQDKQTRKQENKA